MTKKVSKQADEKQPSKETKLEVEQSFEENDLSALKQSLEEAQSQAASHWDKLLRKEAEMQNLRKRADTDVANARKYGIEKFAEELLAVVDSFEQALSHKSEYEGASKAIFEGMELTYKVLINAMSKFGIKEINPVGETFNPEFHEAMMMQESKEHKPNQIMSVVQKGFLVHERVLRPARVIVAKSAKTPAN